MMTLHDNAAFQSLLDAVRQGGVDVAVDSRQATPGGVFVAMAGSRDDGARYVADALEKGVATVVAGPGHALPAGTDARLVAVDDPKAALGTLAAARFGTERMVMPVVAVTGTNGKTTVSYLIERLAQAAGHTVGVLGTVAYRWPGVVHDASLTTPDCLAIHENLAAMAQAGCTLAVMEASSHALDQDRLAGLSFAAAAFTNLTQDHLDYHKDMAVYFEAKAKLFRRYLARPETAVLNFDDAWGLKLLREFPQAIGYGLTVPPAGFGRLLSGHVQHHGREGQDILAAYGDDSYAVATPLPGRHNAQNILAACGVALALGWPAETFAALADCHGAPGRLERIPNPSGRSVFVDYAHTPDALENVLSAAREFTAGRLFVVFGCGGNRDRAKRPLMGAAVARLADVAVLTSDNPRHEDPLAIMEDVKPGLKKARRAVLEPDRRRAIELALSEMRPEDVLVIAGKGHETYQQIGDVKHPFSDAVVVRELTGCA